MKRFVCLVLALLMLVSPAWSVGVGDPAPDFSHYTLDHGAISLSDYSGQVVLLFFFVYW